ncbi:hypothetical protein [Streptomyces avicenniae]|uniref:hypothetical protein n=1 Tax=Streptomyces avicenniae TaxID=500153 RepID=UPI00069C0BB6|nr:hypothetical protein [Streptomyces avicenniae]
MTASEPVYTAETERRLREGLAAFDEALAATIDVDVRLAQVTEEVRARTAGRPADEARLAGHRPVG